MFSFTSSDDWVHVCMPILVEMAPGVSVVLWTMFCWKDIYVDVTLTYTSLIVADQVQSFTAVASFSRVMPHCKKV